MAAIIPLTEDDKPRYNGGVRCDLKQGPCSCGAWHRPEDNKDDDKDDDQEKK